MKTYYYAVCDAHKEFSEIFMNPRMDGVVDWENASRFLRKHFGCDMWLAHTDEHMDMLFESEYCHVKRPYKAQ